MPRVRATGVLFVLVVCAALTASSTTRAEPAARDTSADAWVTQICTAVGTWQRRVTTRSAAMGHLNATSVPQLHDALVNFLAGVVRDTSTLIGQTDHAGTPAVTHGAEIASGVHSGFVKVRTYFTQDLARAKRLSTTDAKSFGEGATAIGASISKQAELIEKSFNDLDGKYRSAELERALNRSPACAGLR
jgi:hypothetical protein